MDKNAEIYWDNKKHEAFVKSISDKTVTTQAVKVIILTPTNSESKHSVQQFTEDFFIHLIATKQIEKIAYEESIMREINHQAQLKNIKQNSHDRFL
jgi:hypothetical protein